VISVQKSFEVAVWKAQAVLQGSLAILLFAATVTTTLAAAPDASSHSSGKSETRMTPARDAADRIAIRELIDQYAYAADRKQTQAQANLFTEDAVIEVHTGLDKNKAMQILRRRSEIASGFGDSLKKFDTTMHFNGQSVIHVHGDQAVNESYALAHHFWMENGKRMLLVMGIRYEDTIVRKDGRWLFSRRKLTIDWTDKRPSEP
jgi:ketosteroid isomerase-like protein